MNKRETWGSKLTKSELKHLKEVAGATTISDLKINFEYMKDTREKLCLEPCFECKIIARKLGFPV